MIDWAREHAALMWWLTGGSVAMAVGSLLLIPPLIVRIPADYFCDPCRRRSLFGRQHPVVRGLIMIGRNALGLVLVALGIAMLVLPGQGLLTIVLGVFVMDVPGKYRLERWAVSRPKVLGAINWQRRRKGREPLRFE